MEETPRMKGGSPQDDLSIVLGFAQMLCDSKGPNQVVLFATDHGWLDAGGQVTAAGSQLARALLQQSGTRSAFRLW